MPSIDELVGSIVAGITRARQLADLETAAVAEEYRKNDLLREMTVPRMIIPEVKVDLPILAEGVEQRPAYAAGSPMVGGDLEPETDLILAAVRQDAQVLADQGQFTLLAGFLDAFSVMASIPLDARIYKGSGTLYSQNIAQDMNDSRNLLLGSAVLQMTEVAQAEVLGLIEQGWDQVMAPDQVNYSIISELTDPILEHVEAYLSMLGDAYPEGMLESVGDYASLHADEMFGSTVGFELNNYLDQVNAFITEELNHFQLGQLVDTDALSAEILEQVPAEVDARLSAFAQYLSDSIVWEAIDTVAAAHEITLHDSYLNGLGTLFFKAIERMIKRTYALDAAIMYPLIKRLFSFSATSEDASQSVGDIVLNAEAQALATSIDKTANRIALQNAPEMQLMVNSSYAEMAAYGTPENTARLQITIKEDAVVTEVQENADGSVRQSLVAY